MLQGTVKWFDTARKFGIITRDDGGDVNVASANILAVPPVVKSGQRVQFDTVEDRNGTWATHVGEIGSTPTDSVPPVEVRPLPRYQGRVKWFDSAKKLGIITKDDGGDVKVATANILDVPQVVKAGQRVQFDTVDDRNGTWAISVSGLSSTSAGPATEVSPMLGLHGTVARFDTATGVGLITWTDGGHAVVQAAGILAQPPVLSKGQGVQFDISERGLAINVSVIAVDPEQPAAAPSPHVHGDHFYTTSSAERDSVVSAGGYRSEGVACYVFDGQQAGTTSLYRLFSSSSGDHFYTTSGAERDSAVRVHGYRSEGIACYVFGGQQTGTTPLHRLFNEQNHDHFYTTSIAERDSAVKVHGYESEGVACYVFDKQQAGATALHRLFRA